MTNTQMTYKEWADLLPHTIFEIDNTGTITFANEEAFNTFGYTRDDLDRGLQALDMFVPEDRDIVQDSIQRTLNGERLGAVELTVLRQDGTRFPALVYGAAIYKEGQPIGLTGSVVDISANKQVEHELRESEEKLRRIFNNVKDQIAYLDEYGTIIEVNSRVENIFGYKPEEVIGKNFAEVPFIEHDSMLRVVELFKKAITSGTSNLFEFEAIRKDGNPVYLEVSTNMIRLDSGEKRSLVIIRDITDRKRTEETLHRIQKAIESSNEAIGISDSQGNHFYQNKAFTDLFGYSAAELAAKGGGPAVYADSETAREVFDTIRSGESWVGEVDMNSKDGRKFPVSLRADAVKDDNGKIIGLIGIHTDITERKKAEEELRKHQNHLKELVAERTAEIVEANENLQIEIEQRKNAEEALRESEQKFRTIFEEASDGIIFVDEDGTILDINKQAEETWGQSREEVIGKDFRSYGSIFPENIDDIVGKFVEALEGSGDLVMTEVKGKRRDGSVIFSELSGRVVQLSGRKAAVAITRDITERKQAEETIRKSEERFRALIENAAEGVAILNSDGTIQYISPSSERVLGYDASESLGNTIFESIHPEDQQRITEDFTNLLQEPGSIITSTYRAIHKDGTWRVMEIIGENLIENQNIRGIVVNFRDITERQKAEEALRESEEKFRMIFENVTEEIIFVDSSGTILDVNNKIEDIWGYTPEEVIGKKFTDFEMALPDSISDLVSIVNKAFSGGEPVVFEVEAKRKDGNTLLAELSGRVIQVGGRKAGLAIVRDITERKKAEEALRASEERFRSIIENAHDAITLIDAEGHILYDSPSVEHITGYKQGELLGTSMNDIIHPDDMLAVSNNMAKIIATPGSAESITMRFRVADGSWRWIEGVGKNFLDDPNVQAIVCNFRDVTERIQAEEQLHRYATELQQANSELSEYSQVVIHDIGTPLRAIRYHTRILRGLSTDSYSNEQNACLNTIDDAVSECEELAQNLMELSQLGRSELHMESVDTGALLKKVIGSSGIADDVDIVLGKKWPTIHSDPTLLSHIYRNLIDNAIKFNDSPRKRVELRWKTTSKNKHELVVKDNGIGIDPQYQEEVFQVFRRLHHQDEYKGTGIGLAIVKKSIGKLGGSVRVESKPGKGSTFVVTIPARQGKAKK